MKFGLLVFFAAGTLAAPFLVLDEHLPRAEVKDDGCTSLRFPGMGTRYSYQYAGETISQVAGSTKRSTGLQIKARVSFTRKSPCLYLMDITDSELLTRASNQDSFVTSAESSKFKQELEKYDLLFTMTDGDKITSVRAHKEEPIHVLNIKRGILSAFQLDAKATSQADVHGVCKVDVRVESGKFIKTVDLDSCDKRGSNEIGIQGATFEGESKMKPLTSTRVCSYGVVESRLNEISCEESHLFRPFSAGFDAQAGAMTTTKQTFTFVTEKTTRAQVSLTNDLTVVSSLIYDHGKEETKATNTMSGQVEKVINRLVDQSRNGNFAARQESAHEFGNLVKLFRRMDTKRMQPVWTRYYDCIQSKLCQPTDTDLRDLYRQYLLDAISYCGTSTCITVVHKVIVEGGISGERMNMILQGIALVGKTSRETVRDVLDIAKKQPSRQAFLTLGTLLNRHCRNKDVECKAELTNPITQAERYLESQLGQDCSAQKDSDSLETILMAMKAIGNAGRPVSAFPSILACARNSVHNNLTVAAFDAIRHMPCNHEQSEELLAYVSDENMCPEKRSHAFKALIRCHDEVILHKLVHRLTQEPSKQLASFMWTTLTNVMESSDPKHAETKAYLKRLTESSPLREVDLPFHQFSRAFEKSFHLESIKTGATAEGHILFNPNSYLPKSAFANFTAHIMGVPVHIVETAIQLDGIESLLEDLAGPDGILPENTLFKIFNFTFTKERLEQLAQLRNSRDDPDSVKRQRRDADDNLTKLHKDVNKKRANPSGSLSFKVMGQEVRIFSYDDLFWAIDKVDNMNVIQLLMDVAKGGHKTFSKSMLFLEMTHSVPTGLGLPLRLKLLGSTVSTVELDGKFDIRNLFWGPSSMHINGYVRPSAVVEISGEMSVDSHLVSTGLYVNASVFASQMFKGGIIYKQGQTLQVNLDVPDEPIQVLNFSSTPFMFMNEESQLIEGVDRKISPDFCASSKLVGFGVCSSFRVPVAFRNYEAPYFPLSGPAHFGLKLVKGDEKLTTFQFLATMKKTKLNNVDITTGLLELSTPGATYERRLSGDMRYEEVGSKLMLVLGTRRGDRRAEWELNYDGASHSMGSEVRSNLFTSSDVNAGMSLFNVSDAEGRHFGVRLVAGYGTFQVSHETKYVAKITGGKISSKTTYYPEKTIEADVELNLETRSVVARMEANQIKQAVELKGQMTSNGDEQGIKVVATHVPSGKAATFYGGLVKSASTKTVVLSADVIGYKAKSTITFDSLEKAKRLSWNVDVLGKNAELKATLEHGDNVVLSMNANVLGRQAQSVLGFYTEKFDRFVKMSFDAAGKTGAIKMGYYQGDSTKTLKLEADIVGRKAEMFAKWLSAEGHRVEVGGVFGKYQVSARTVFSALHGHGKSLCSSVYYTNGADEVEPVMACALYDVLGSNNENRRLTLSVDFKTLQKNFKVTFDVGVPAGHAWLKTNVLVNDDIKMWNSVEVVYAELANSELTAKAGCGQVTMSFRAFSAKKSEQQVGLEVSYNNYVLGFINSYSSSPGDSRLRSEIMWNGKILPASTQLRYFSGALSGFEVKFSAGEYSLAYTTTMKSEAGRTFQCTWTVKKGDEEKLRLFKNTIVQWSSAKSLEQQFGIVALGRTYQYGYSVIYTDKSTASKTAHAVKFVLAYSTTRSSSLTLTFANSDQTSEVQVDVEYLPGKTVSHYARYAKASKEIDAAVEFLPKMYVKFSSRLDTSQGVQLTSGFSIEWDQYKRSIQLVHAYSKKADESRISSSLGDFFEVSASYKADEARSVVLRARLMSKKAEVIATLIPKKNTILLRCVYNDKEFVGVTGLFDQTNGKASLDFTSGDRTLSFNGFYAEAKNKLSFSIFYNSNALLGLVLQYKKAENVLSMAITGTDSKPIAEAVASYITADQAVLLKLSSTKVGKEIAFAAKWNPSLKSITLSGESAGQMVGMTWRADWINYVLSSHMFYNTRIVGWQAQLDAKNMNVVYNITLTPTLSAQVVFQVLEDRILKMTVQRKIGSNVVDEVSARYTLTSDLCQFAFNWNKDTVDSAVAAISDVLSKINSKVMTVATQTAAYSKVVSRSLMTEAGQKAWMIVNSIDKGFDDFDFLAARDKTGEYALRTLKQASLATQNALRLSVSALDAIKENLPKVVSQTTTLVKSLNGEVRKNLGEVTVLFINVAKNLTESARPVVHKAISLAKGFKIRGKTAAQWMTDARKLGEEYAVIYLQKMNAQWKELQVQLVDLQQRGTNYILTMRIPYRQETVGQVIEIVVAKVNEMRKQIDVEKMLNQARSTITTYKINGKTIQEHLIVVQEQIKSLPESSRLAILKALKASRIYVKDAERILQDIQLFAQPLTDYIRLVGKSTDKHFGPLVKKAYSALGAYYQSINYRPSWIYPVMDRLTATERFVTPLVRPLKALYENLMRQVRSLRVLGVAVGPAIDQRIQTLKKMIDDFTQMSKDNVNRAAEMVNKLVGDAKSMTPEQIVDLAYDKSGKMAVALAEYMQKLYAERANYASKVFTQAQKVYGDLQESYQKISQMDFSATLEKALFKAAEDVGRGAEELASIVKQIAAINVAGPSWDAWIQADIVGHLRSYGVNDNLVNAIDMAKKFNATVAIRKLAKDIQVYINNLYDAAFIKAVMLYNKLEKMYASSYEYARSIPKKTYDEWFQELQKFTMSNKDDFVAFAMKMYSISQAKAEAWYQVASKAYETTSQQLINDYAEPAKQWYNLIAKKTNLVYDDLKEPSIALKNHYQAIATKFINEKYSQLVTLARENYERLYREAAKQVDMAVAKVQLAYNDFLEKHGDKTWEQVFNIAYTFGEEKYKLAVEKAMAEVQKMQVLAEKIRAKYEEYYLRAQVEYKNALRYVNDDVKPKVIALYNKYVALITAAYEQYYKQGMDMYKMAESRVVALYESNKDKTLRALYKEARNAVTDFANTQYKLARAAAEMRLEQIRLLVEKYYAKADVLMRTVLLPEFKVEVESMINQTLRASVELGEETVRAFTPHFLLLKDATNRYVESVSALAIAKSSEAKAAILQAYEELVKIMLRLIEQLKNSQQLKNLLASKTVTDARAQIESLYAQATQQLQKLQGHPKITEYQQIASQKYAEYRAYVEARISEFKNIVSKYQDDERVVRAMKVLKQLQASGRFTSERLLAKLKPLAAQIIEDSKFITRLSYFYIQEAATAFRRNPEETFWTGFNKIVANTKTIYAAGIKLANDRDAMTSLARSVLDASKKSLMSTLDECTDQWTKDMYFTAVSESQKLINQAVEEAIRIREQGRKIPDLLKEKYAQGVKQFNIWAGEMQKKYYAAWEACPYNKIFRNKIWGELADEAMSHELVILTREVAAMAKESAVKNAQELFSRAKNEYEVRRVQLQNQLQMWKEQAEKKYKEVISRVQSMYSDAIARADKFLDETRVVDIVNFANRKFAETKEMIKESRRQMMDMINVYREQAEKMIEKYQHKLEKKLNKHYKMAREMAEEYRQLALPYFEKVRAAFMEQYNKYYPIVQAKYSEIQTQAMEKYTRLMNDAMEYYKKLRRDTEKWMIDFRRETEAKWMTSTIRTKLIALKKMTIRETIKELRLLPSRTREAYNELYRQIEQEVRRYTKIAEAKYTEILTAVRPTYLVAKTAADWISNEVSETAVFVYRYYRLADRYNSAKNFVVFEVRRIAPMIPAMVKTYYETYRNQSIEQARIYASKAGHGVLKGIHSSIVYMNQIDTDLIKSKARSYVAEVGRYISFDSTKMEITISIPHGGYVEPRFSSHIKSLQSGARRVTRAVQQTSADSLEKIKSVVEDLKEKATALRADIMTRTSEFRRDLELSGMANKKIFLHIYQKTQIYANKYWNDAVDKYNIMKEQSKVMYSDAVKSAKQYVEKAKSMSKEAYTKAVEMVMRAYENPIAVYNDVSKAVVVFHKDTCSKAWKMYEDYAQLARVSAKKYMEQMKVKTSELNTMLEPYALSVKVAARRIASGESVKTALSPVYMTLSPVYNDAMRAARQQLQALYSQVDATQTQICNMDQELCNHVTLSWKIHKTLFSKYADRLRSYYNIATIHALRAVRMSRINLSMQKSKLSLMGPTYRAAAMIFGNSHVLTFDQKYYDFVDYKNEKCTYVLARDFQDGKFTVYSQQNSLIIEAADMKVVVASDGTTVTTMGTQTTSSLPVKSKSGSCERMGHVIKCLFMDLKFKVVIDLKHFAAIVSLSGWHHGKTQGLLGTNNRETYDEWRVPNGKISSDIYEFANAYEVTGDAKCVVSKSSFRAPTCDRRPSARCTQLFQDASSPFADTFSTINAEAFLKACEADTSDCSVSGSVETSHCNATAAFAMFARAYNFNVRLPKECIAYYTEDGVAHHVNTEWVQKPLKRAVDVVVLMSERTSVAGSRIQFNEVLTNWNERMGKFDMRFALVGFGGHDIHEKAHSHPLNGRIFTSRIADLTKEIESMPYSGVDDDTNDAYQAILRATTLRFRPGASRVFIMYNTVPHTSHEHGPSFNEALYALTEEANATLFVFDQLQFKSVGQRVIIGQTTTKAYSDSNSESPLPSTDLPSSEFKEMVEASKGGLFSNKIKKVSRVAHAIFEGINEWLDKDSQLCKRCRLVPWYSDARPICQASDDVKC